MKTSLYLAAAALIPASGAFAGPPPLPRYFPLDAGNQWTYVDERTGSGEQTVTVLGFDAEDGVYRVQFGGDVVRLRDRQSGQSAVDIELGEEGLVAYYLFGEESFIHRDFLSCEDSRTLTAAGFETIDTPAGTFEGCLRLEYGPGQCVDAGVAVEWWKADVGRVKWTEDSFIGPRSHVLKSFDKVPTGTEFQRGDADQDGSLVISDPILILTYLFLTLGETPKCLDALDADDNGQVELTDAVRILGYLFLGAEPPAPPGPGACGTDPTDDDPFKDCKYEACPGAE